MGKLVGSGDVATGKHIRQISLQVFINLHGALRSQRNTDFLEPEPFGIRLAANCKQHPVEGHSNCFTLVFGFHEMLTINGLKLQQPVAG